MGDAMKNILMMVSCIVLVGFVWSIITLINSKKLVEQYNAQVAQRILSTIA
jgi:hypothetical protein